MEQLGWHEPPPWMVTVGAEFVPWTVADAVALAPLGSRTVTVAVKDEIELTVQAAVAAVPAAQPCHVYAIASPSGSDA